MSKGLREFGVIGVVLGIVGAGVGGTIGAQVLGAIGTTTAATIGLGAVGIVAGAAVGAFAGALLTVGWMAADDGIDRVKEIAQNLKQRISNIFGRKQKPSGPQQTPTPSATQPTSKLDDKPVGDDFKDAQANDNATAPKTAAQPKNGTGPKYGQ